MEKCYSDKCYRREVYDATGADIGRFDLAGGVREGFPAGDVETKI